MRNLWTVKREQRLAWEKRWGEHQGDEFTWNIDEVPNELQELLDEGLVDDGPALDLGCGTSVVTSYLAQSFSPTVGIDLAVEAVRQARGLARGLEVTPVFAAGDAAALPLASSYFALVFDRGCLQNVPYELWAGYWRELERVLRRGAYEVLYCSRPAVVESVFSPKGARRRAGRILHGARKAFITASSIQRSLPPSMNVVRLREAPYQTSGGHMRIMVYGLFKKAEDRSG